MKWLLLLALVACSTMKKNEQTKDVSVATETESKPISPYTVKPCFCEKIFSPVCADGTNYGNSCEAECHGHKKWTEGNCQSKNKYITP